MRHTLFLGGVLVLVVLYVSSVFILSRGCFTLLWIDGFCRTHILCAISDLWSSMHLNMKLLFCHHFVHPNTISLFSLDVQALLHLKEPTVLLRCREMDRKVVESVLEDSKREYVEKAKVAAPQLP